MDIEYTFRIYVYLYMTLTMQYIYLCKKYTIEYYSAIKKKEIMLLAARWMNLEVITLSEVRRGKTNII